MVDNVTEFQHAHYFTSDGGGHNINMKLNELRENGIDESVLTCVPSEGESGFYDVTVDIKKAEALPFEEWKALCDFLR